MDGLPHLRMAGTEQTEDYTFAGGGGGEDEKLKRPDRPKKDAHARLVRKQLQEAQASASVQRTASEKKFPNLTKWEPEGVVLTFESDPEFGEQATGEQATGEQASRTPAQGGPAMFLSL